MLHRETLSQEKKGRKEGEREGAKEGWGREGGSKRGRKGGTEGGMEGGRGKEKDTPMISLTIEPSRIFSFLLSQQ